MAVDDDDARSRRGAMKLVALLAAGAGAAGAARPVAAAPGADAELIAVCADWHRALAVEEEVSNRLSQVRECDWSEDRRLYEEVGAAEADLLRLISDTRATSVGVAGERRAGAGGGRAINARPARLRRWPRNTDTSQGDG